MTVELKASAGGTTSPVRRDPRIFTRRAICIADGILEGVAAGGILLGTTTFYHLVVLQQRVEEVPWLLYYACAALTAVVFGGFAAASSGRLLDRGQWWIGGLPESFYAWTSAIAMMLLTAYLGGVAVHLSRISLTTAYIIGIPVLLGLRSVVHVTLGKRIQRGELFFEKIAVIGHHANVVDFLLNGNLWRRGHRLAGVLYLEDIADADIEARKRTVAEFGRMALRRGARHIVLVGDISDLDAVQWMVDELRRFAVNVVGAPATKNRLLRFLDVVPIGPNNALRFSRRPLSDLEVSLKRGIDIAGAGFGLLLLSPMLLFVAAAILVTMGRPIIYKQERRGFNGDPFMVWKFRSMRVTESGHAMQQAEKNDPRVTPLGQMLRSTSIDELPQLINVLRGQMSLVGPRPHAISHDKALELQVEKYAHRQRVKPGITGWAQVNGFRGETRSTAQSEGRVRYDLHYIDNWSPFLDVWIILLTVFSPTTRRNAH